MQPLLLTPKGFRGIRDGQGLNLRVRRKSERWGKKRAKQQLSQGEADNNSPGAGFTGR